MRMLETVNKMTNPVAGPEPDESNAATPARKSVFSTGLPSVSSVDENGVSKVEGTESPSFRINWEIKALVPIACVLLGGMLLFLLATISWRDPERHLVLLVAGAGAVAICGALLVVLTYMVQRPMVELQQKIAQLGSG